MATLSKVADRGDVTGEGPLWHPDQDVLYWVDIPAGALNRYDPERDTAERVFQADRIGGFTIQADGDLLLFMDSGAVKTWNDGLQETILEDIPEERDSRFNDVVAGPNGRVYCGTMPEGESPGRLYRLETDGRLVDLIEGVAIPNGMAFTPDQTGFYLTETLEEAIYRYAFDAESGVLGERTPVVDAAGDPGLPDGLTVDAEGYLWSARWNGWSLVRHAPDGRVVERVSLPARKVSAVTFGGPDYGDAYVTTALPDEADRSIEGEGAGALYRLDLGIAGVPEWRSRVCL